MQKPLFWEVNTPNIKHWCCVFEVQKPLFWEVNTPTSLNLSIVFMVQKPLFWEVNTPTFYILNKSWVFFMKMRSNEQRFFKKKSARTYISVEKQWTQASNTSRVSNLWFNQKTRVAHLRRAKSLLYIIATDMKRLAALSQEAIILKTFGFRVSRA